MGRAVRGKAQRAGVKPPRSWDERGQCPVCIPGEAVPATSITPGQQQRGGEAMARLAGHAWRDGTVTFGMRQVGRNRSQSIFANNAGPEGP